jgi:hypothetical protein
MKEGKNVETISNRYHAGICGGGRSRRRHISIHFHMFLCNDNFIEKYILCYSIDHKVVFTTMADRLTQLQDYFDDVGLTILLSRTS